VPRDNPVDKMKAYKHLVKYALGQGLVVSVWDGEAWDVQRSNKLKTIIDCIESVEEADLKIRDVHGKCVAWALVSAYGLADDETVINSTDNNWMADWLNAYDAGSAA
jgi:hypothetical protein